MRLQVKATRDRISFAVMSIMFAECWAFSQIQEIEKAETIKVRTFKPLSVFKLHSKIPFTKKTDSQDSLTCRIVIEVVWKFERSLLAGDSS